MSETETAQPSAHTEESDAAADRQPPRWLVELREALASMRELAAAQVSLLGAEWRLARAATHTAMLAGLAATVFAVALGLTLLALLGWALAQWFGSWLWALLALAALQVLGVVGAIALFRRCLRWMSFPRSRAQAQALVQQSLGSTQVKDRGGEHGSDTRTG